MYWSSSSGEIALQMTKAQAHSCSHSGDCEQDVQALLQAKNIKRQLDKLKPETIAKVLKDYGTWDKEELKDAEQNKIRLLWRACCDADEEQRRNLIERWEV